MADSNPDRVPENELDAYLAPVPPVALSAMLSTWQWLPIGELRPTSMTLMGDVLFLDAENQIYLLDTSFGVLERIATSREELDRRLDEEEGFARRLLRTDLVDEVQTTGVITSASHAGTVRGPATLASGQTLGFAVPLIAGGRPDASNVIVASAAVYLDMQGQLTRGACALEPGTEFATRFEGGPEAEPAPPGAQRRRLIRAPRDRGSLALSN